MVNLSSPALDRMFHALAQPTRRAILEALSQGERTVGELAEPFDMSLAAVSKHLRVLEDAELVVQTKVGRTRVCAIRAEPFDEMSEVIRYYQHFWQGALDHLDAMLTQRARRKKR